jgi:iron-sulfur cluster repair protein YtfE (RIC family)
MRRHDALIPLTHDHHHALAQVRKLKSAAKGTDDERRIAVRHFLEFFSSDTLTHFREEEELIFPLVVDVSEMRRTLERVMMQHLHIHALVHRLRNESDAGIPTPESLLTIATSLEQHIRFEEKVVFPLIESIAGDGRLEVVELSPRSRVADKGRPKIRRGNSNDSGRS